MKRKYKFEGPFLEYNGGTPPAFHDLVEELKLAYEKNEELEERLMHAEPHLCDNSKQVVALMQKISRYEEALKFYANENHFNHLSVLFDCDEDGIQCGGGFVVVDDGIIEKGTKAKKALEETDVHNE